MRVFELTIQDRSDSLERRSTGSGFKLATIQPLECCSLVGRLELLLRNVA